MRTTILGATGFIGGNLVKVLDAPYRPRRRDLYSLNEEGNLGHVFYSLGNSDYLTDICDTVSGNLGYLAWFLKACDFESLTYLSTARVYLGASSGDEDVPLVLSPRDPGCIYSAVKLAAESICLRDPRCKVVRLGVVVGPTKSHYDIPGLIRDALKGQMILSLTRDSARDYIALSDVLEILPKIHTGQWQIYNLASGVNTTLGEVVAAIQNVTGATATWRDNRVQIIYPVLSVWRVCEEFDFTPKPVLPAIKELCRASAMMPAE